MPSDGRVFHVEGIASGKVLRVCMVSLRDSEQAGMARTQ